MVGFANALLVTGDQKYADAWRDMIDAVNAHARVSDGRTRVPDDVRRGAAGMAGSRAVERGRAGDLVLVDESAATGPASAANPWVEFLDGKNPAYPETALERDLASIPRKLASHPRGPDAVRTSGSPTTCWTYNPAATDSLVRLMLGALVPSREGGLLNARLRYFDPVRRRAGVPEDVAALVSELDDRPHGRHAGEPEHDRGRAR